MMTVIEQEPVTHEGTGENTDSRDEEDERPPVHLYMHTLLNNILPRAMCGLPASLDWHSQMHDTVWSKGMFNCPVCGAPICMDCVLQAS